MVKTNSNRQKSQKKALRDLIPKANYADFSAISLAMREKHMADLSAVNAAFLATVAYIRHQYTEYDDLRDEGYDHDSARFFVAEAIDEKLAEWGAPRGLETEKPLEN